MCMRKCLAFAVTAVIDRCLIIFEEHNNKPLRLLFGHIRRNCIVAAMSAHALHQATCAEI